MTGSVGLPHPARTGPIVDADGHVVEPESAWNALPERYRPRPTMRHATTTQRPPRRPLDVVGLVFSALGLGGLTYTAHLLSVSTSASLTSCAFA